MGKELFKNIPSKVGDLVKDVRNGRIGLPDLQRPFVWRDNKVRELFDSMFFNGRISLTPEHFLKISPRFEVKNELDAMMALHQSTILGMSAILHDNALSEFAEITKKITERKTLLKVNRFIVALGGHEYFSFASKRLISIYLRWMKDFEKYIPATMLSLGGVADKLNRDSFGIATTSFEDMKAFYADSYLKGAKKIPRKSADGHEYMFSEGPIAFPDPWDRPGRTMLTSESTLNRSTHVVSDPGTGRLRLLTPVEAERLQGFDDEWTNTGMPDRMRYFCMGNALVVPMITRMGRVLDTIIAEEK